MTQLILGILLSLKWAFPALSNLGPPHSMALHRRWLGLGDWSQTACTPGSSAGSAATPPSAFVCDAALGTDDGLGLGLWVRVLAPLACARGCQVVWLSVVWLLFVSPACPGYVFVRLLCGGGCLCVGLAGAATPGAPLAVL